MREAYICDAVRTPFGRYGGGLAPVRPDDLAAVPLKALMERNPGIEWSAVDDVILGCANQAGEDNRNVARMAALLAGLPETVPGTTVNRLCGSGMDSIGMAARAIKSGEAELIVAGGVESLASASSVVSGRGCSSAAPTVGSPLRRGMRTGSISRARRPDSWARPARCWLRTAKASWSARETA